MQEVAMLFFSVSFQLLWTCMHRVSLTTTHLQSLHKVLPSTTLYYKACTKHFPVLLCTTKLAQSTSQYYFVLQSFHKVLPSTTLYYKGTLRYAFGKNMIIWDEHPKSSNHQLNAILPITNQHTHNLEFCMLIVISYVIS